MLNESLYVLTLNFLQDGCPSCGRSLTNGVRALKGKSAYR